MTLRRRTLLHFSISAAVLLGTGGCGGNAAAPDPTGLAGEWKGQFRQVACTIGQIDQRPCAYYQTGVLALTVSGDGEAMTAELRMASFEYPEVWVWGTPAQLRGTVDGRRVSMTGGPAEGNTGRYELQGEVDTNGGMTITLVSDGNFDRTATAWLRRG